VVRLLTAAVLLGLNTALALLLLLAGWLRETPHFWRNAGGFPVLVRELVKYGFAPCFSVDVLLVGAAGVVIWRHRRAHRELARLGLLLAALQTLLLAGVMMVVTANNLDNLINGRPFHWKPAPVGDGMSESVTRWFPTGSHRSEPRPGIPRP
jgi:formate hydrogenlyase subunit 3/multisubunit Na+/H+ antiporter MnhD subunit